MSIVAAGTCLELAGLVPPSAWIPSTARMTAAAEAALSAGGYKGAAKQKALSLIAILLIAASL